MADIDPKIFKEYDIRGEYPWEINEDAAYRLALAFAKFKKLKKVVIARDARPESAKVAEAFSSGLVDSGCRVYDLGVDGTPALFFAVSSGRFDGGAIVTASHNPHGYTGLKMCGKDGLTLGSETGLKAIAVLAEKITKPNKVKRLAVKNLSVLSDYYHFVLSFIDEKKIRPLRLVFDVSNGSAAKLVNYVFVRLSGRTTKMNFKKGDKYPDHGLSPILPQNQQAARAEVKKQKADLGVIWDGDGDRAIFIDEQGRFVEPYHLNCLICQIMLAKFKKIGILADARLTQGISQVVKENKGRIVIGRSGYANILRTMKEKKLLLGCENSGHLLFSLSLVGPKKKDFIFSDAVISVLLVLEYLSENKLKMSEAVAPFRYRFFISGEKNFKNRDFGKLKEKILKKFVGFKTSGLDGLSVFGPAWSFNVRPSHTEPLVRLNVEAENKNEMMMVKKEVMAILSNRNRVEP